MRASKWRGRSGQSAMSNAAPVHRSEFALIQLNILTDDSPPQCQLLFEMTLLNRTSYIYIHMEIQKNVKNVFDTAIMTVLDQRERKQRSRLSSSSFRASLRRLSRRKNLSRSLSDASSSHSSSTSSMQRKSRSFNTSIRDIFCFG